MSARGAGRLLAALLAVWCLVATAERDGRFEAARSLLEHGRFDRALQALEPLAEEGHLEAQAAVAAMYLKGLGVPASPVTAMGWYCRLAHQPRGGREVVHALWFLAEYHRTGGGVPGADYQRGDRSRENPLKALFWFRILAGQRRYYEQVVDEGVRIGRMGVSNVERQLFRAELEQVELRLADWHPRSPAPSAAACLDVP